MTLPFFTIGHSNRSLEDFVELLKESQVQRVVDVRKMPKSRANPQFNKDMLPGALAIFQISYEHVATLGGLRGKTPDVCPNVNGFWENKSFRNYADYALSETFHDGFRHLVEEGPKRDNATLCQLAHR